MAQVVVLYVDQQESVKRQMARAQLAALHNTWVLQGCLNCGLTPGWP
jgi:hypothetical protein